MHPRIPTRKLSTLQAHDKNKAPHHCSLPPAAVHGDAFHIHLTILNRLPNEDAIRISFSVVPLQMARYNHRATRWSPPHSIPTTNSWCTMSRAFMIPDGDSRIGRVHTANRRRWIQITVHDVGVGFNERITPRIYCSATLTVEIYSWHV